MSTPNTYYVIDSVSVWEGIAKFLMKQSSYACDFEATGLNERTSTVLGVGFSWKAHTGVYLPLNVRELSLWPTDLAPAWGDDQDAVVLLLRQVLEHPYSLKFFHNAPYDLRLVQHVYGVSVSNFHCTLLYTHIRDPKTSEIDQRLGLEYLLAQHGHEDLSYLKGIWSGVRVAEDGSKDLSLYRTTKQIGEYCCGDCDGTFRIGQEQCKEIVTAPYLNLFRKRMMPLIPGLVNRMRTAGVYIDRDRLSDARTALKSEYMMVRKNLCEMTKMSDFSPNCTAHLQVYFIRQKGYKDLRQGKMDEWVLREYWDKNDDQVAKHVIWARKLEKLISTYCDNLERHIDPKTGRVHSDIKLWGTETGRLSASEPNLMNQPSRENPRFKGSLIYDPGALIKRLFIPGDGHVFVAGDYSQIELRLIAEFSQDPILVSAYSRGLDLHALTASNVFGVPIDGVTHYMRSVAKQCNFGLCYGGSAGVLVQLLGNSILGPDADMTVNYGDDKLMARAKEIHEAYFRGYSGILPWASRVIKLCRENGYVLNPYGFIRYFPEINSDDNRVRHHAEKAAVNTGPQGTAALYLMFRFLDVTIESDLRGLRANPMLTVHDQMASEVHEDDAEKYRDLMAEVGVRRDESNIQVPMVLEPSIGRNLWEVK